MSPIYLRVRELREARGWTQVELAERAGLRRPTISAIENEQTKGVDFDVLERLANALGVDPGFLIVRSERARDAQR
jgi:transcriptional regulator with XRE-family HTH domain